MPRHLNPQPYAQLLSPVEALCQEIPMKSSMVGMQMTHLIIAKKC